MKVFPRLLFLGIALALNVVLFGRLLFSEQGLVAYRELKAQHLALEEAVKKADAVNLALSREIRLLQSDDRYVEKMIRKRLNFVRDNEIVYLFPDAPEARSGVGSDEGKN